MLSPPLSPLAQGADGRTLLRNVQHVQVYAKDEQKFFEDFANVFAKLLELGVPTQQFKDVVALKVSGGD